MSEQSIDRRFDVLVTPFSRAWIGGADHAQIPEHGRVDPSSPTDQFPEVLRQRPTRTEVGRHLYAGPYKHHFGHVMVDSIPRLWAFDRNLHEKVVFACLGQDTPSSWFFDIIGLFGVRPTDVLLVREPTVFTELDFPVPGATLQSGPKNWYLEYLETLPLRRDVQLPSRRLYFGRTHILQKGTLMGETYFSEVLQRSGFSYVKPEDFDIHAQAAMTREADQIVFLEGSSIYSIEVNGRSNTNFYIIPRRQDAMERFSPQIAPRASLTGLGLEQQITRKALGGRERPRSPSFCSSPDAIHQDLLAHGLIREPFDEKAFRDAESADYLRYRSLVAGISEPELTPIR